MTKIFNILKSNWVLVAILFLALFFRVYQINHFPGGLFPDEAANGIDINSMSHGQIQPFYERGNGREALFFYFEALSVWIFGLGVWQFHIVSALFGFASVVALYFLAKRMFNQRVALLATFFFAVSSYASLVTRTAFRATAVPFFSIMTILFLVKFFQETDERKKYISAALSGAFFALGFYTYTSYRMMLPLVFGFLVLLYIANRSQTRELFKIYTKYKIVFAAAFLIAISWLALWFIQHPGDFLGRANGVSVFNKDLNGGDLIGTVILVAKKTILSFFTKGDLNWRQNVAGYPFLSPFISPFFGAMLILFTVSMFRVLKQAWTQKVEPQIWYQGLLATWAWFMMVPEAATAEGIPHGLRLIGIIPPMFIITAWGVNWTWEKLRQYSAFDKYKTYFAAVFLVSLFVYNYNLYFAVAVNSPGYYYAYRSDLTDVSNYLNQRNKKNSTYLSLDEFSVQTTEYLTSRYNQPYRLLDPAHTYEVNLRGGDQVVFTQSTIYDTTKFLQFHPDVKLIKKSVNQFNETIMMVYQQP